MKPSDRTSQKWRVFLTIRGGIRMSIEAQSVKHKLIIKNAEKPLTERDEYELAEIVVTNGFNQKEHIYTVWCDESTFVDPIELGASYIFLYEMESFQGHLNLLKESREELAETFPSNPYAIEDFMVITKPLERALRSNQSFLMEIPDEHIKHSFLHLLLVESEAVDITYKAHSGELTKKDLIDLGRLVDQGENQYQLGFYEDAFCYLQQSIEEILKKEKVKVFERAYLKQAFSTLQLDSLIHQIRKDINFER